MVFSRLLEGYSFGEIKSYHKDFLPFGVDWNTNNNYAKGISFSKWASTLEGIDLAASIEFPYANVSGIQVSKDGAGIFGKAIAYSIRDYLESIK